MIGAFLYLLLFCAVASVGLPIGFATFGRRHAAGWVAGALMGYGMTAVTIWMLVQAGVTSTAFMVLAPLCIGLGTWWTLRGREPWVPLPSWKRRDTIALLLVLLIVPLLQWRPFARIGELDADGARRYRAYFTADFLWHVALTSELTKFSSPPRNPYLSRRPLHYYWSYFVVPAVIAARLPVLPDLQSHLLVNAACAGLLFVAMIFVLAWCIVPRAGPVAVGVTCVLLASSAEGSYALWDYWSRGRPLSALGQLNIDAITSWWFQTLTIDGLPRSLWYTPQHAMACAFAAIALTVATHGGARVPFGATLAAGLSLGLAVAFSPFLGGTFSLIYGGIAVWTALRAGQPLAVARYAVAAVPVAVAVGWCVLSGTFEGAGGSVAIGLSSRAAVAPLALLGLALGPVLVPAAAALLLGSGRTWPISTPVIATTAGLCLLFFVTLTLEPIWIGWRAGQIILVTIPALVAACLARLWDLRQRTAAIVAAVLVLAVGLPTTLIDAYNAQDVSNTSEAAGFHWTLVVPADTQTALKWLREQTPGAARVQMSIGPRRRDSWTLIPTFAERRMAAGRPISLLDSPEYDELSRQADEIFRTTDSAEAARLAHELRLQFLFVDDVERQAFGEAAIAKFDGSPYFSRVFASGSAVVYAVR